MLDPVYTEGGNSKSSGILNDSRFGKLPSSCDHSLVQIRSLRSTRKVLYRISAALAIASRPGHDVHDAPYFQYAEGHR